MGKRRYYGHGNGCGSPWLFLAVAEAEVGVAGLLPGPLLGGSVYGIYRTLKKRFEPNEKEKGVEAT